MPPPGFDEGRSGTKSQRGFAFGDRLIMAAFRSKYLRIPGASRCIVRVELDGPPEFFLCPSPIAVVKALGGAQRGVSLGQRLVEFERLSYGSDHLWPRVCAPQVAEVAERDIGLG